MKRHIEEFTIYAVDFDGTLCTHEFPGIGKPNKRLIKYLIRKREEGDKVILWTNRMGERLNDAVLWCNARGLFFDAVNENIPEAIERYKHVLNGQKPSPKITADVFIDDAACNIGLPFGEEGCGLDDCWENTCTRRAIQNRKADKAKELTKLLIQIHLEYGDELFRQIMSELDYFG